MKTFWNHKNLSEFLNWFLFRKPLKVLRVRSDIKDNNSDQYPFIERLDELTFAFDEGACNTFQDSKGI